MKHKQIKGWKLVRNTWISSEQILPGVWQRKEGGHVVRARVIETRSGKQKDLWKVLPDLDQAAAYLWLQEEIKRVRDGVVVPESQKVPFATYAVSLLERKIKQGDIQSAAGIEKWGFILEHLIASRLGELYVDQIRPRDILTWKDDMTKLISSGDYMATTINTWFSVLKVVMRHAKVEHSMPSNPCDGIDGFDTSRHRTYTYEEPNSLTVTELQDFLATMREKYPQHFGMTFMGFATGLRPSTLRPVRRGGATPDVLWDRGQILIRQSQTRGNEVMVGTKTATDQTIAVPQELLDVLRWHVDTQLRPGPQRESILLFPSERGGFRASSCLDKPFKDVARSIGLTKKISPRAMRRSFQDLARAAEMKDLVTRSISGHATEVMQHHYSTVSQNEQKEGLAKVIGLFERRKRTNEPEGEETSGNDASGEQTGEQVPRVGSITSRRRP